VSAATRPGSLGLVWSSSWVPSSWQSDDLGTRAAPVYIVGHPLCWRPVRPLPGVRGSWCIEPFDLPDATFDLPVEVSSGDDGCRVEVEREQLCLPFLHGEQCMWEQQFDAAAERDDLRAVAAVNTEENFGIVFDEAFADVVIDRQTANEDLFRMFFDKPEFQEALTAWARKEVYQKIRTGLGDTV